MSKRPVELHTILSDIRRRWTTRSRLRAWALGATAAGVVLVAGVVASWVVGRPGLPLVVTVAVTGALALTALWRAMWPTRHTPSDSQIARFVEERVDTLDDVVVTAVDYAARPDRSSALGEALEADAVAALAAVDLDVIVARSTVRRWAVRSLAASALLLAAATAFAPYFVRATGVSVAYLFPARVTIDVTPGDAKVRAGLPVTISARIAGATAELIPTLTVVVGEESRTVVMDPAAEPGVYALTIDRVTASFGYRVGLAGAKSDIYDVTVVHPPRVERIDVAYEFPAGLGLAPRTDEDSGDVFGPAGTKARLSITADKPIASAELVLEDGSRVPLAAAADGLAGQLTIDGDGSYRIALIDTDGLSSDGDTEYFIRTMDDRPPDVRILRPASDRHVTALEEVLIEARADDDYGIASFELVFQSPNGKQRTVPLQAGALAVTGAHTLFMEDLGVQPGDFVTYYARARDINRGRRSVEARSDIFFLEVKPFEEEFVAAQSQAMGQGAGMQGATGLEGLADAQKEIIVATWKLDARARRARDAGSERDIKAVATAQSALRTRAEQTAGQIARTAGDPRRRRNLQGPAPGDDPLGRAIEAMGRAASELGALDTTKALPFEMDALNQLLKAEAEIRRRQITRGQQAGGGGGMNRAEADLSTLFDQELRRRQQTNYETPNSTESREDETTREDPLERIRELARRQNALNERQRDLARNRDGLDAEALKRQLERLTREQNELRQQAETLAQQMASQDQSSGSKPSSPSQRSAQASGQSGQSSGQRQGQQQGGQSAGAAGGGQSQQDERALREISESMRDAATGMRRQDNDRAAESGTRAADGLRDLERRMQAASPDDRRRALGDLQLETRQLADAQRRVAGEAARTESGESGDDARRRLAGEQERLADRAARLQDQVARLARTSQPGAGEAERRATEEAARDLERQRVAERMRSAADDLRKSPEGDRPAEGAGGTARDAARQGDELARALDRIADRLGAATGAQDADSKRLSDQLTRTQQLRDLVGELERKVEALKQEASRATTDGQTQAGGEAREGGTGANPNASADPRGPQRAQGTQAGSPSASQSSSGREGAAGAQGGTAGGSGGRLAELGREVNERMREAERLTGQMQRDNPGLQGANPDQSWWRSFSAPGTEAFKQDFARWESLKSHLLVAIEDVESKVSTELRGRENHDRLNAGGHQAVSEPYRELVDKYYRSLAAPRNKK